MHIFLFYCISIIISQAFAQIEEIAVFKNYKYGRYIETISPFETGDYAVGFQTKGKLTNILTNYGELSTFHLFYTGPALEWPAFGEGQKDQQSYGWGVNLLVGYKGDVIEAFQDPSSNIISRDWQPAMENLFSGKVTVNETNLTPIMATSDNKDTWPIGTDGNHFWPGIFRKDTTGTTYPGQYTSERDLYCVYTDEGNDTTYGLRVEQTAYSFSRRYAEDFLVYRFNIKNTSGATLDNLYPGMINQLLVDFDREHDSPDLINYVDSNNDGQKDLIYMWDEDGIPQSPWIKVGYIGLLVVNSPINNGITNFHFFDDEFIPKKDEDFWMVLTSDTTGIPDTIKTKYFHGDDVHIDDVTLAPELDPLGLNRGGKITWSFSSGPVSLSAGDSLQLEIAIVCGDDEQDLLDNVAWVWFLANNAWNGSNPPNPPIVKTYSGDEKVTVTWDTESSENSRDNINGNKDFEGYKVYRSTNQGESWGDIITDPRGDFVAYEPLAQFDLINEINGYDPISNQYLGRNTGLQHTFVDSNVINGMEYWYSVTAYDGGDSTLLVESLESALGLTTNEINIDNAIPASTPVNYIGVSVPSKTNLEPDSGLTDGKVSIEIIDQSLVKSRNYKLKFYPDTPVYEDSTIIDTITTFTLKDTDTDEILILNHPLSDKSGDNIPIVDGFRLKIVDSPSGVKSEWTLVNGDTSTFIWTTVPWGANDYEIIYTDYSFKMVIDTSATGGLMAPWFDVWSGKFPDASYLTGILPDSLIQIVTTTQAHLPFKVYMISFEQPVDVSNNVYLGEFLGAPFDDLLSPLGWDLIPGGAGFAPGYPYPDRIIMEYITAESDTHGLRLVTQNGDSTAIPPSHGDEFTVRIFNPFSEEINYTFSTTAGSFSQTNKSDLKKIKVVPNPYFVTSAFDSRSENRLMFTHLPNECNIVIYTVAGDKVRSLYHNDDSSIEYWDIKNDAGLEVAYGLYVYVVKTNNGEKHIGKFSVIR